MITLSYIPYPYSSLTRASNRVKPVATTTASHSRSSPVESRTRCGVTFFHVAAFFTSGFAATSTGAFTLGSCFVSLSGAVTGFVFQPTVISLCLLRSAS